MAVANPETRVAVSAYTQQGLLLCGVAVEVVQHEHGDASLAPGLCTSKVEATASVAVGDEEDWIFASLIHLVHL